MTRFSSVTELAVFLGKLDPDYAGYATALWQKGIRTSQQLANAREQIMLSANVPELHIDDIQARTGDTGEQVAHSVLMQHYCVTTLSSSTHSKCSHSGSNNTMSCRERWS